MCFSCQYFYVSARVKSIVDFLLKDKKTIKLLSFAQFKDHFSFLRESDLTSIDLIFKHE